VAASARLQAALEDQISAGSPGAIASIEAPGAGLVWTGSAGRLAREESRSLRPDDAFRIASVTKNVTAAVAVRLAHDGRLVLDNPLNGQLDSELLNRWRAFEDLPETTPRQLLAHTSGLPNYFGDEAFIERVRREPDRAWDPAEFVDHVAERSKPDFRPGEGFSYSDTGYTVVGILLQQITGQPLHSIYREVAFNPLGMQATWLEGHEASRQLEIAHHYDGEVDMTELSPTIDWAGGGLVTTGPDLTSFVRGLWSGQILDSDGLDELTSWTAGACFPPGYALRYDDYGLGTGRVVVEGVELIGHTGFIGAFAFHAPGYDAVLLGTHNQSQVDRWPLVGALCRELRDAD
jgi:D-alanyl-D-alanine carboxypeptidase